MWLDSLIAGNATVLVPEIADYEIRRDLLRTDKKQGIARLDAALTSLGYLPITTAAMRLAAELWASARTLGKQTADDVSLDIDMMLCAQALELAFRVADGRRRHAPVLL